jgi:outer membrane receptor for ferric coprogen and ferric-rhodotorulic acid
MKNPSLNRHLLALTILSIFAAQHAQANDAASPQQLATLEVKAEDEPSSEHSKLYQIKNSSSATKLNLAAQETPQTINVLTRQQLDDLNSRDIRTALANVPGVTVSNEETDRTTYLSRGFEISNILVDGIGFPLGSYNYNMDHADTFLYDRIEVIKGADALTNAFGDPGATINLIRKRPTKAVQASASISYGSWDTQRYEADLSGAITKDGRIRGRVMAYEQTGDSYLDHYSQEKNGIAAILEADVSDSTLLTAGFSQTKKYSNGSNWGANPLYNDAGEQLSYSRSYNYSPDWTYWDSKISNYFVEIAQQLGRDWSLKLAYDLTETKRDSKLLYLWGAPYSSDNTGGVLTWPGIYIDDNTNQQFNISLDGHFRLWGRQHEALFGYTWAKNETNEIGYNATSYALTTDLASWSPSEPEWNMTRYDYNEMHYTETVHSLFAATRLHLSNKLKWVAGGNFVQVKSEGTSYGVSVDYDVDKFNPYTGLTFNFTPEYTGYISYTSIFRPQSTYDANGKLNDPIDGDSYELGIKSAWLDGRLSGTLAIFKTQQNNYPLRSNETPVDRSTDVTDIRSQGVEVGLTGQLTDALQLSFGFSQFSLKDEINGGDARTYNPTQTINLNATYTLPQLPQLKLGAAVRYQNDVSQYFPDYDATLRQDAYALVDLMASYQINPHLQIQANGYNITNEKYLNSFAWGQAFYGAPANYTVALKFKY